MEGHEVPKNVSDFEFHLVGDMTLKQFGYLATGLGIAYLIFVVIGSSLPFLAWPLIFISAGIGAAYAFLPILDRPLDHWTLSFFKSIFTPTERTWQSKLVAVQSPEFKNRLNIYLSSISNAPSTSGATVTKSSVIPRFTDDNVQISTQLQTTQPAPSLPKQPPTSAVVQEQKQIITPAPIQTPPVNIPTNLPTVGELEASVELAKEKQIFQNQLLREQKILGALKEKASMPGANPLLYSAQMAQSQKNISLLNEKISKIAHELAILAGTPISVSPQKKIIVQPHVSHDIKLTLTSIPNVINGIVTDSQGNYLEGVVVVTHDKQGLPVRALKTNKLGQFLAATPLPNGTYSVTLEKDNLNFDIYEVTLNGSILPPLKIAAKKQETLVVRENL